MLCVCCLLLQTTLPSKIVATPKFADGDVVGAIIDGYRNTDNELLRLCDNENWPDGATGVVAIIHNGKLYTCKAQNVFYKYIIKF